MWGPVAIEDQTRLIDLILRDPEPAYVEPLAAMLKGGANPRANRRCDAIGGGSHCARDQRPQQFLRCQCHCYEYCNTLGWFYDHFDHPRRLRLLFLAASFLNCTAWHQKNIGDQSSITIEAPGGADRLSQTQLLDRLEAAMRALNGPESAAWTRAYLDNAADRGPLIQPHRIRGRHHGYDTHNQEIAQVMLEDYATNRNRERDLLLIAAAYHTAAHRKYGDQLRAEPQVRRGARISRPSMTRRIAWDVPLWDPSKGSPS